MLEHDEHTVSRDAAPRDDGAEAVLRSLRQIIHAVDVQSKRLTRETGLSTPQLIALAAVRDLGEVTTRALSAEMSLTQSTVTTILDRLEQRGLVERYRSARDRRIVHTRLTEAGAATLAAAPPLLHQHFTNALAALSAARRTQIIDALRHVARMMGADGHDPPPALSRTSSAATPPAWPDDHRPRSTHDRLAALATRDANKGDTNEHRS